MDQVKMMRGFVNGTVGRGLQATLLVSAMSLVSGCGWFDGSPSNVEKARPGLERAVSPSESLPPPAAGQNYTSSMAAVDETRGGPAIGSIIAASGGQKAQIEKQEKDQAERDKADREAREKAVAANKSKKENYSGNEVIPVSVPAGGDKPGEPPTQPVGAPPAPVAGTPIPPPAADATPPATDVAPSTPPAPAGQPSGPDATTKPAGT